MGLKSLTFLMAFVTYNVISVDSYDTPTPVIELLNPTGFRVSIPDSPGVELFAFHGNINQEMKGNEAGQYSVDVNEKRCGLWTYENPTAPLNPGDTLYFWTHVRVHGKGYEKFSQQFQAPDRRNETSYNVSTDSYDTPTPVIEVLKPTGFRVSIPDSPGVELFAFHGNINEKMKGNEAGQFSVDINHQECGLWTYENPTASLNPGDTLYFWTHVRVHGKGYEKFSQEFHVPDPRNETYDTPTPVIEILKPTGFRVSIPDSPGVELFAFHGNLNVEMKGNEAGQYSADVNHQRSGLWIYENPTASLNPGDTLYFWTHVRVHEKGYEKFSQQFHVPADYPSVSDCSTVPPFLDGFEDVLIFSP